MWTIYKYNISPSDGVISILTFKNAKMVSCGQDASGTNCIWLEVNTKNEKEYKEFYCVGTGWNLDEIVKKPVKYVGHIFDFGLIWHIYEVI